jgi:hypothetical protein
MRKDGLQCHQDPGGQAMGNSDPALGSFDLMCYVSFIFSYRESVTIRTIRWIGVLASGVFGCLICDHS